MNALKKPVNLLGILLVLILLVQIVLLFLPYFNLHGEIFSLQDFAWFKCEEINPHFEKLVDDYYINDYVMGVVLSFVFGALCLLMTVLEVKYAAEKHATMGTVSVKILGYIFGFAWLLYGLPDFLGNSIHSFGTPSLQYAIVACMGVGTVLIVVRLVLTLTAYIKAKKAKKAEEAA